MNTNQSLKKLAGSVLLVILGFVLFSIFANFSVFDEKLNVEVENLMKPPRMPHDADNAYYAIWGLQATEDRNIIISGKQLDLLSTSNSSESIFNNILEEDYIKILGGINLDDEWSKSINQCISRKKLNCTRALSEQLASIQTQSPRLKLMLQRYRNITELPEFKISNGKTMASELPPYSILMKLGRLNLATAFQEENADEFISVVEQDLEFWRRVLAQGSTLIDKMIAVASIWSNIQAISEYVSKNPNIGVEEQTKLNHLLRALSPQQKDIGNAFIYEQKIFITTLTKMGFETLEMSFGWNWKPISWLIQPNATFNDYYQYFTKPMTVLAKFDSLEYYQQITNSSEEPCCDEKIAKLATPLLANLYNLGGKLILSVSTFQAHDYISRVHDLDGMLSLARLKLALLSVGQISEAVKLSSEKQPYNKKPMNYDKQKNMIEFDCLSKDALCKVSL